MWTNHVSTSFKRTLCFQMHYSGKWPCDLQKAINDHLVKSLDNKLSDIIVGQDIYICICAYKLMFSFIFTSEIVIFQLNHLLCISIFLGTNIGIWISNYIHCLYEIYLLNNTLIPIKKTVASTYLGQYVKELPNWLKEHNQKWHLVSEHGETWMLSWYMLTVFICNNVALFLLDHWERTSLIFASKYGNLHRRKWIWQCRL